MEALLFFEKIIWFGLAAMGFAILFNVPARALPTVLAMGAAGGITKIILLGLGINVILASFAGAAIVGLISIYAAHIKHAPPLIFSIPSVIPLVPGAYAYKMMLGLIQLASETSINNTEVLNSTVTNGLKAFFILLALAAGVALPMLITRKESAKQLKI